MKLCVIGDSLSAPNTLVGPSWPLMLQQTVNEQACGVELLNLSIDGLTFQHTLQGAPEPERDRGVILAATNWAPDMLMTPLGGNDGLFNIDNLSIDARRQWAAAYFRYTRMIPSIKTPVFVRMQATAPGLYPDYDAFLDYCWSQQQLSPGALLVNVPYYLLRDAKLLMNDAAVFAGMLPIVGDVHPSNAAKMFVMSWVLKHIPQEFNFFPDFYPNWNDPDQAIADLLSGAAPGIALRSGWNY